MIKYYMYILKSIVRDRKYIGITADLNKRLEKHNQGAVRSTKAYRPWKIIYFESFPNKTDARKRELNLKQNARAREDLFKIIDR